MEQDVISIIEAKYVNGYSIEMKFSDNTTTTINFEPFFMKSKDSQVNKYLDKGKFRKFLIVDGNLNWNHNNLTFPIEDLHEGKI